jgi:hypothetical protein
MSPHVHFLGIFHPNDKPHTADDYDKFLSAEMPDPVKNPLLFAKVRQHMIHTKCGHYRKGKVPKPCENESRECQKFYPFEFVQETQGIFFCFFPKPQAN